MQKTPRKKWANGYHVVSVRAQAGLQRQSRRPEEYLYEARDVMQAPGPGIFMSSFAHLVCSASCRNVITILFPVRSLCLRHRLLGSLLFQPQQALHFQRARMCAKLQRWHLYVQLVFSNL